MVLMMTAARCLRRFDGNSGGDDEGAGDHRVDGDGCGYSCQGLGMLVTMAMMSLLAALVNKSTNMNSNWSKRKKMMMMLMKMMMLMMTMTMMRSVMLTERMVLIIRC